MRSRQYIPILVVLILVLAGCGGFEGADDSPAMAPSSERGGFEESPAMDADEAASPAYDSSGSVPQVTAQQIDRRVIRTAEIDLEVSDVERSIRHVRDTTLDAGGFVASSSTRIWNDRNSAEMWIEVPSEQFDDVISRLREGPYVEQVARESTSSQDVTEEYVDLQSRIRNLEATEQRYVALLAEARNLEEILSVERELTRIRGEIEQIQGRINYLEQRTSFSRIYVSLIPTQESIQVAGVKFTPLETAREAWEQSMEFMATIASGVIIVVVFFWWLWPLLLVGAFGVTRWRRRRAVTPPPAEAPTTPA
jgi:hypothetical protein